MKNRQRYKFGDNMNLADTTYVGNIATAHLQAAKKILMPGTRSLDLNVVGEAFHIT